MQVFAANDEIIATGSKNNVFYIIAEGSVTTSTGDESFTLKKGDIVGIYDITLSYHSCSYYAAETCNLIPYSFENTTAFLSILEKNMDLRRLLMLSLTRNMYNIVNAYKQQYKNCHSLYTYIKKIHEFYQDTCRSTHLLSKTLPFMEDFQNLTVEDELPFWLNDYYVSAKKMFSDTSLELNSSFVYGFLSRSSSDIEHIISLITKMQENYELFSSYLLNEDYLDFFDLYCDLYFRSKSNGFDVADIDSALKTMISHIRKLPYVNNSLIIRRVTDFQKKSNASPKRSAGPQDVSALNADLANSLNIILDYADTMPVTVAEFKKYLQLFMQLPDKNALDKEADNIRRQISKLFYLIYVEVFQISLKAPTVPPIIKMFLNFGYMDASLCGYENATILYKLADTYHGNKEQGVYTIYEWIREIYDGNKQPSRNEFEQNYTAFVRTLKKEGKIDKETELDMTSDTVGKVMYELQNMFPSVNKITFGRVFSFCPILLEENICKPLDKLLLTPEKICDTFKALSAIDYSAFYHDILFEDTSLNIKEIIKTDIRPDVILMPNTGTKGILWQEIEGMHRSTKGRMMISAFFLENLEKTFIRMIGEFRWDMCKRIQGGRWNDVTSHSLTSEYCDYAQFYQKNRDLSYDAKEKIKVNLKKSKNNYRELFLNDYMVYMLYESTGSCRLNKVARSILFKYCPFSNAVCESIKANSVFTECLDRHHLVTAQALHRIEQVKSRYQNSSKLIPDEISLQPDLIKR